MRNVVFHTGYNNHVANTIWRITLWDCEGKTVRIFEREDKDKFDKLVTHRTVIYRCNTLEFHTH